jgi:hypothetical protein
MFSPLPLIVYVRFALSYSTDPACKTVPTSLWLSNIPTGALPLRAQITLFEQNAHTASVNVDRAINLRINRPPSTAIQAQRDDQRYPINPGIVNPIRVLTYRRLASSPINFPPVLVKTCA